MNMIDIAILEKVSQLARLKLTEEERKALGKQLVDILNFVQQLSEVNTDGVKPFSMQSEGTPMREDMPYESFSQEEALMNAPQKEEGFFVVPKILEV